MALLVAGVDSENGPALFHTDPSGTFVQYEAKAIGAGSEGAQSTLQDKYSKVCCSPPFRLLRSPPVCFTCMTTLMGFVMVARI